MIKSSYLVALVCVTTLAAALILNPNAEQHRQKIKAEMAERSPLAGLLGLGSLTAFASNYHSLGVMSYSSMGDKTVSIGAFGTVVVLD